MWDVAKAITATIFNVKRPEIKEFLLVLRNLKKNSEAKYKNPRGIKVDFVK